jgi:hypothetical protein
MLSAMDVDEYRNIFKNTTGETLRKLVANCLQFSRIVNAGDAEKEIARRARAALEKIGQESPVNAMRVRKYGIIVDHRRAR